ncbi:MAG TPA: cyclic nucleotide-binding domain-containing protein [Vicinamibacteria bacterium]|nr:cyclic nucleotide-binding domain-containing protein [Vicinamibacteria bacterium]
MPLDWLNTPLDADIGELIAQRKRGKAIETLRRQLQGRLAPPVAVRLQLADLLMQAGRIEEAVPVLLGLADEFAHDGFVAKAVAILKRVDRVQPGRADIAERLEKLVHQQRRVADLPSRPRAALPVFGIEEFGDTPDLVLPAEELEPVADKGLALESEDDAVELPESAPLELEPEEARDVELEATVEPIEDEGAPMVATVEAIDAAPDLLAALLPDSAPTPASPPLEASAVEDETEAADAGLGPVSGQPGVGKRIRRALWRFLASLPGAEESNETPAVRAAEAPSAGPEAPLAAAVAPVEAVAVSAPDTPTVTPTVAPESAEGPSETPPAAAVGATAEEAMSDDAFHHQLLDIVEDVLHRPPPPEPPEPPVERDRARVLDLARRMVASRLFKDLSDEELLAIVRGLRLHTYEPGDILVTEGEPGQSLFTLTTGHVKVFVSNPDRRNFEVATLVEGDFFGEISSLSGRPRSATVVAASACELLELDRPTLDSIARTHARVRDVLETSYIERASSPEVAAVRAVPLPDSGTRRKAIEVLEAHFGESRWDPRMRLRLADVLLKAGKDQDAIAILIGLADELAREGFADKAVAILKKVEQVQRRNVEVVNLAPLLRAEAAPEPETPRPVPAPAAPTAWPRAVTDDRFHCWLVDLVRDSVSRLQAAETPASPAEGALRAYRPGLLANPLFEDFSEEELLAFIHGLKLLTFEPGDVIITEGEPGQSVFILTTGRVRVFVRGPEHRSVPVGALGEGSFFGEISTLSGRPRSATITAAAACEILELDRASLDAISVSHPRVRSVLEAFSAARAADPEAARARGERTSD